MNKQNEIKEPSIRRLIRRGGVKPISSIYCKVTRRNARKHTHTQLLIFCHFIRCINYYLHLFSIIR